MTDRSPRTLGTKEPPSTASFLVSWSKAAILTEKTGLVGSRSTVPRYVLFLGSLRGARN